ncbi:c-type heme family protein [Adhaeribacter radiodurans]|uniref:DUF3365 domain-containing protein n=1 Tax=Adhaeribacter radiodurans TaxID=2745197 RepID=A0A7L7LE53_9BACT|nr:DUF3365 domain-containing protein [Adhaeribacter radiodurans]QMU30964.1 DUF3365 domain-containing protein [Adhaeribacter radiodurans]
MQIRSFLNKLLLPVVWIVLAIFALLANSSCEPKKLSNGKEIADEMERHLVKRITGSMILQETRRVGDSLIRTAEQNMLTHLKTTLDSGNFKAALDYHKLEKYPEVQEIAKKYLADVGRTGKVWPNSATDPASLLLQEQLQQYTALNNQKQVLEPQISRVGATELLYTKPIRMTDPLCLQCHGQPEKLVNLETQKALPENFATPRTGYQSGEWAGMWYVRFKTQGILDSITQKRKKSRRGQSLFSKPDSTKSK